MVRYIMSFKVPENSQQTVQQVVNQYFNELQRSGPGGMRSQCYASNDNQCNFVHIKSFKKESIANHHFRSAIFRQYLDKLTVIAGEPLSFSKLHQQKTFESIY